MKTTGFASMRITAVMFGWADGRKPAPLLIHKGKSHNFLWHANSITDHNWVKPRFNYSIDSSNVFSFCISS
jgi:hypothetical protein